VSALVASPFAASAQLPEEDQLRAAKDRVAEVRRDLTDARAGSRQARHQLAQVQQRLRTVERDVNEAARAVERQRVAVAEARAELDGIEDAHAALEEAFAVRAADVYKNGSGIPLQIVMAAGDMEDALARSTFLQAISSSDQATLEDLENSRIHLRVQRERFAAELAELEEMEASQRELLAEVQALRDTRAARAAQAASRVSGLEEERDDLEADQKRLKKLIEERRSTPVMGLLPSTSGYIWPICAPVTSEYGMRWGRLHAGMDFGASSGSPIGASKAGRVIYAAYQSGYGNLTLIEHADGVVTAYAHQTSMYVGVGQSVGQGERIGTVGSTGNSTGPHLHFETRVNGSAVNPRQFLSGGC
jgi:murein DD-endopeptidase MepM/ murein hydrolase activator NlpD